jgi:hypothetical protein
MKRYIVAAAVIVAILGSALVVLPRTGLCLGCLWKSTCYDDSICGMDCVCVKRSTTDVGGFCAVH